MKNSFIFFILFLVTSILSLSANAKNIPSPPSNYALDEVRVLNTEAKDQLFKLLSEHYLATGEQIVIAVFDDLEDEDLVDFTNRVFSTWKIGQKGKNNGV
ncbi:MAG: TPM domain-containing protein, partial [Bdellovibrio sp.]|nr:TPM domain-containing protein [Bdellovibrio sp.]